MPRKSRKNVGLIGLGLIGSRVAAGLRAAGYHVFVWNRNPRPVPNFLGSPLEVAELCEVIQLFVADGPAVFQTIEAFGDALTDKHVVVNCATIGPEATMEAARMVQARGAAFLDSPFTGSKGAAEKSQLVYYVGGEHAVFERVKPVLEASSRAIVHCGKVGDAAVLKVATNMITAVTTQTLAEALAIVRRRGIAPEAFGAAIQQNACKSGVVDLKLPKMLTGDYSPHFSVKHMFKDVQLAIQLANSLDLEIPATAAAAGVLFGGMNKGWADMDFASVFKQFSDIEPAEPVKALSPSSESKATEVAALVNELERAEFVEAQIISDPTTEEPEQVAAEVPAKAEPIVASEIESEPPEQPEQPEQAEQLELPEPPEPPEKTNATVAESAPPKVEEPAPRVAAPVPSASHTPTNVDELAEAIVNLQRASGQTQGATGEAARIAASIQKAKVIEAEVIDPEAKADIPSGESKGDEAKKTASEAGTRPDDREPGFRPFQRLRRFFSPAGK
jgi:3-hydroxyisobutyrate dehydrogenase-like beta-hydroxyacid dehydrogenase